MPRQHPVSSIILAACGAALTASVAVGQSRVEQQRPAGQANRATGGGAASSAGSGGFVDQLAPQVGRQAPVAPNAALEFRRRNAVITGNVVGGRGFQGTVGYGSPFDFGGDVGSDDLFEFRSRSALSAADVIRATGGATRFGSRIQFIEQYRTSAVAGGDQFSGPARPDLTLGRLDARSPQAQLAYSRLRATIDNAALQLSLGSWRERSAQDRSVGRMQQRQADGTIATTGVSGSSLLGLRDTLTGAELESMRVRMSGVTDASTVSLGQMDLARLREDAARTGGSVVGYPILTPRESLGGPAGAGLRADPRIADSTASSLFADSRQAPSTGAASTLFGGDGGSTTSDSAAPGAEIDLVTAAAATGPAVPDWQRMRDEMALRFAIRQEGGGVEAADEPLVNEGDPTDEARSAVEDSLTAIRQSLAPIAGSGLDPDVAAERVRELGSLLKHGQRVEALVDPEDRTRAGELIARGEQSLKRGEYFKSERFFTRALNFVPNHPTASVGLVHARIGAGLQIPAALRLEDLFRVQPEMIGASFADSLVPNRPRLIRVLEDVRVRAGRDAGAADRAEFGLLIAYLGRLLDRGEVIQEGLRMLRDARGENDPFLLLLNEVWRDGEAIPAG